MKWFQQTQIWEWIRFEIQVESRIRILSVIICHANLESESKIFEVLRISILKSESINSRIKISGLIIKFDENMNLKIRWTNHKIRRSLP